MKASTNFKVFIPKCYYDYKDDTWVEVNQNQENWLKNKKYWVHRVKSFKILSRTFILVIWEEIDREGEGFTIYKGTLKK